MPTIRTNGVDTYYERHGEGPPVVFAHGATNDHRWWEPQVEALADDYEVITYDTRGCGKTGGSDLPAYTMDVYALDLRALVEGLELEQPAVVGHSLGGMFALPYAVEYPDALGALVLADAQVDPTATLTQRAIQEVFVPLQVAVTNTLGRERADAMARWISRRLFDVEDDEDEDDELREYTEETTETIPDEEMEKITAAIRSFERVDLSAIDVPTLGLYGEEDPEMMHHNAVQLRREVPDCQLRFVDGAGHGLSRENSEQFNAYLREFLDEKWR